MKNILSVVMRVCKVCKFPKSEKEFRGTQKVCNTCDNTRKIAYARSKREEARKFLGF